MLYFCSGEMAERSNAAVLKTVVRLRGPGVRIPLSPQNKNTTPPMAGFFNMQGPRIKLVCMSGPCVLKSDDRK